jgi:hypothetical protein
VKCSSQEEKNDDQEHDEKVLTFTEILDAPTPARGLEYCKFLIIEPLPSRS